MRPYDLNTRTALMTVSDEDSTLHALKTKVVIKIATTIPLLVIDAAVMATSTLNDPIVTDATALLSNKCGLTDDVDATDTTSGYIANRFIFITKFKATVSGVTNKLYYDKAYKDIIVIPDISRFDIFETNGKPIVITGHRIGNVNPNETINFKPYLSAVKQDVFELPVAKPKIGNTVSYNLIPGIYSRHGNNDIQIEQQLQHGFNHYRVDGTPGLFVKLGTITELFDTNSDYELPFQLVYQESPSKYNVFNLGISKTNGQDLYIMLQV